MRTALAPCLLACALHACQATSARPPEGIERVVLHVDADGLSGLARDGDGALWAIAESAGPLVRIEGARGIPVPLDGVPAGLDTESLAWLGEDRFAIGTESMHSGRPGDLILIARLEGARARVVDRVTLDYAELGIEAEENHGIEALCAAGGRLFAVTESVRTVGGSRRASLAIYSLAEGRWEGTREIVLGSETGKIAGLACRTRGAVVEAHAVERHFGVARILRFELAPGARDLVRPSVVRNLDGRLDGDPNLEGIEHDARGLVLIVDNHYRVRTGPNELVYVR
ncbi:MAG TPA: hypothetical protein VIL20_13425 [Sandaracinaceae bacterium]